MGFRERTGPAGVAVVVVVLAGCSGAGAPSAGAGSVPAGLVGAVTRVPAASGEVVGHPGDRAELTALAAQLDQAVPAVVRLWGSPAPGRELVVLPSTDAEFTAVVSGGSPAAGAGGSGRAGGSGEAGGSGGAGGSGETGGSGGTDVAAVAQAGAGVDRVVLRPGAWRALSPLGRRVVLRHEVAHLVSATATTSRTPLWLVEGLAETAGWAGETVPARAAAPELAAAVRAGRQPAAVPADAAFASGDPTAGGGAAVYQEARFACRTVVGRVGTAGLVRLYRLAGRVGGDAAVSTELHLTPGGFAAAVTADVRAALS